VASLAATFGRGAMTNGWTDVANSDVILVMGGNPAENHPVGFRFVMEARKKRNARLVCIDPRFNRTAAVSDIYMPIRAGTDIAVLGGLIHYTLNHGLHHDEYVRLHTNASFMINEEFGFEEGLFTGWDGKQYDKSSWTYQLDEDGYAKVDPTLENPKCVFQLLKKHYSRYTPEMVASIAGCTVQQFERAAKIICSTGRPDGRGTVLYALGWTQHSHSVQLIHTAAMLQLLLGNIGVPGGGINAQRGHSNIQGATDLGAWDMLPGYLRIPRAHDDSLQSYLHGNTPKPLRADSMNYWSGMPRFFVSLLKSYYGETATAENEFGYQNLPKLNPGDEFSWGYIFDRMHAGRMDGLISFGMNPVAAGPNSAKMIAALSKLKWMIVAECFETETAAFWRSRQLAGEYYPSAVDASQIETEVFLLPAACFAEKEGAFINSSRWLQWKHAALDPPGQAKRDQEIIAELFLAVRRLYETDGGTAASSVLDIDWRYANPMSPSLEEVARELNGQDIATGKQLSSFSELRDDGTTRCGNWLYCGSFTEQGNMMARRGQSDASGLGFYHDWAWNWPANRRVLYNRASADAEGRPWDPMRAGIAWNGDKWVGDVPDYKADATPQSLGSFIMLPEGVAKLFAADFAEGPFPEHYEPVESPVDNALHPTVGANPLAKIMTGPLDALGNAKQYPYVGITYRLTEHFHYWTKHIAANSQLQPNFFVELPVELADMKGIASGDLVEVTSARGRVRGRAMVTRRMRPLPVGNQTVYHVGLPIHWGFLGSVTGPLANNLSPSVLDPNSGTPEFKGFLVNVEKVVQS
jgi:formate dehydrogenase major subunit